MQGVSLVVGIYILPIKGVDVILRIQWLQQLDKVAHDYALQTMEFIHECKHVMIMLEESLCMKRISLQQM